VACSEGGGPETAAGIHRPLEVTDLREPVTFPVRGFFPVSLFFAGIFLRFPKSFLSRMNGVSGEVVSEAVKLSEAVFCYDEEDFEESYGGEADGFLVVEDLKSRIDEALIDSGGDVPYLDDLPSFPNLGYDAESWARVFYSVEPGVSQGDLADASDFSASHVGSVLDGLESEGLVESRGSGRGKKYFYGENALPYLMVFSEAERILETRDESVEETAVNGGKLIEEDSGPDEEEQDEKSLQDIMMDVADGDEDLQTTYEQEEDGGIDSRDHTDSEVDEETSNPGDDEYYEGW
jgi:DNA-binding transcriptional regulator GbsR (MarR family)